MPFDLTAAAAAGAAAAASAAASAAPIASISVSTLDVLADMLAVWEWFEGLFQARLHWFQAASSALLQAGDGVKNTTVQGCGINEALLQT